MPAHTRARTHAHMHAHTQVPLIQLFILKPTEQTLVVPTN